MKVLKGKEQRYGGKLVFVSCPFNIVVSQACEQSFVSCPFMIVVSRTCEQSFVLSDNQCGKDHVWSAVMDRSIDRCPKDKKARERKERNRFYI